MIVLSVADISRAATGGLLTAVWEGAVLATVVGLGLRLLPRTPAAVRFAIWFAVFGLVAVLPLAGLHGYGAEGHTLGVQAATSAGRAPWLTIDARWCFVVLGAWLMASAMRAVTLVWAVFRVRALWKRARPLRMDGLDWVDGREGSLAATHSSTMGLSMNGAPMKGARPLELDGAELGARGRGGDPIMDDKTVDEWGTGLCEMRGAELCVSDEVDRPTVIGFFAPRIVIPTWLAEKLTHEELRQIVLHEAGHLDRADDWLNLVQKIALVVFPLNPALAWVERRLCFERELACDEAVLAATGAPKAYAQCLARVAEHRLGRRGLTLALGALGRESDLARRVSRILRRGAGMKPVQAKLVLAGAMVALVGAGVGFARLPQVVGFVDVAPSVASAAEVRTSLPSAMYHNASFRVVERMKAGVPVVPVRAKLNAERRAVAAQNVVAPMESAPPASRSSGRPRMVNLSAEVSQERVGAVRPQMVQLVVMTAWLGEDGHEYMLTAADGRVVQAQEVIAPVQEQADPSAVAVRDGWVVFEL